jgi:hypothetical protein
VTKEFQKAKRKPHPLLDKVKALVNVFVEVSEPGTDLSIIPVTLNLEFLTKDRPGPRYMYGPTRERKFEFISLDMEVGECQTVGKEFKIHQGKTMDT